MYTLRLRHRHTQELGTAAIAETAEALRAFHEAERVPTTLRGCVEVHFRQGPLYNYWRADGLKERAFELEESGIMPLPERGEYCKQAALDAGRVWDETIAGAIKVNCEGMALI